MVKKSHVDSHPEVARDFHPTKNGDLTASELVPYGNQKVWWRCPAGHEYAVGVYTRLRVGCRLCNRLEAKTKGSLRKSQAQRRGSIPEKVPVLLQRWDFEKNAALGIFPEEITPSSRTDVFWKCEKNHSYQRSPKREHKATHCPICYEENKYEIMSTQIRAARLDPENTLAHANPEVAAQWNYEKNDGTPFDYTPASNQKVWWICPFGHSWNATIDNRTLNLSGAVPDKLL